MYLLTIFSALASLSLAQINPDDVDIGQRDQWCTQQKTSCPLLCLQYPGNSASTTSNDCDPETLSYSCVCIDGQTPNASEYSQTIPYFICTEQNNQCVNACGHNNACSDACRSNNPCGAKNPTRVNSSTITSTMPKTTTDGSSSATGSDASDTQFATLGGGSSETSAAGGDGTNANGDSGASQLALDMGRNWGLAVVLGGVFAGVALVL